MISIYYHQSLTYINLNLVLNIYKSFLYILCLTVPWQIPVYLWIYKKKPKNMKKRSFYFLIKAIYFLTPLSALIILVVNNWYTAIVSTFSKKEFFLKINAYILSGELLIAFLALIFTLYSYYIHICQKVNIKSTKV